MKLLDMLKQNSELLDKVNTLDETASDRQKAFVSGMMVEEMSELTKEIMKIVNRGKDRENEYIEELADVTLLLDQLFRFADPVKLQAALEYKMNRYLERYGSGRQ